MKVATLGIDIGKTWFHIVGLDAKGTPAIQKQLRWPRLMQSRPEPLEQWQLLQLLRELADLAPRHPELY